MNHQLSSLADRGHAEPNDAYRTGRMGAGRSTAAKAARVPSPLNFPLIDAPVDTFHQLPAMSRTLLRRLVRCMAAVLLLGQLAVAAYACPALRGVSSDAAPLATAHADVAAAASVAAAAADCGDAVGLADPGFANLCTEHCKSGQQSDHTPSMQLPVGWPVLLYDIRPVPRAEPRSRPTASSLSALVAASPPHAIAHCVRRT